MNTSFYSHVSKIMHWLLKKKKRQFEFLKVGNGFVAALESFFLIAHSAVVKSNHDH